jgi:hypothetical protein
MTTSRARSSLLRAITAISVPAIMLGMLGLAAPPATAQPDPPLTAFELAATGSHFLSGRHVTSTFRASATGVPWRVTLTSRVPAISLSLVADGTTVASATTADIVSTFDINGYLYRYTYGLHPVLGTGIVSDKTYTLAVDNGVYSAGSGGLPYVQWDEVALGWAIQPTQFCNTFDSDATWSCYQGGFQFASTILVQPDTTAPAGSVTLSPATPNGEHGWYRSFPTATFACTDEGSGVATCPDPVTATADGEWTPTGTVTDGVGNSTVVTGPTVTIDTTSPTVSSEITGLTGAHGWYTGPETTVSWTCTDVTSGLADCPAPETLVGDGKFRVPPKLVKDRAGNTTGLPSFPVNVDSTPPTIVASAPTGPDRTVTFTCDDALSGVESCPSPVQMGTSSSVTVTATDVAGNVAERTVDYLYDPTAPTATIEYSGTTGSNGWFTSRPTATFTCSDDISGVATCPDPVTASADGRWRASGTVVDNADNSIVVYGDWVKIDTVVPVVSQTITGTDGDNGWFTSPATVSWTCSDTADDIEAASGLADDACPVEQSQETDGTLSIEPQTVSDLAGNITDVAAVELKVDTVGPEITYAQDENTFSFECTDATSGVAHCPTPVTLSRVDPTATVEAIDEAGNVTELTISVPTDGTGPTVVASLSSPANRWGWHDGPVTVHFTCTDTESGVTFCPADVTLTRDGVDQEVTGTATDGADNSTTATVTGISIDRVAPRASVTGVRAGEKVTVGSNPARCAGVDTLSGVASCTLVLTRPANGIGTVTVRAVVTDRAGNTTTSAPVRYQVIPKVTVSWGSLPSTLRAGHTYTFTVRVTDAAGHPVTGVVPRYLWPTISSAPGRGRVPFVDGGALRLVSPGVYRVKVTLERRMVANRYWTFGISTSGVVSTHRYLVTR